MPERAAAVDEADLSTLPDDEAELLVRRPERAPGLDLSWREQSAPVSPHRPAPAPPAPAVSGPAPVAPASSSVPDAQELRMAAPEYTPGDSTTHAFALGEPAPVAEPPRPETSADLTSQSLVRSRDGAPRSPLRRMLYRATGGRWHLGESRREEWRRALRAAATTSVRGHVRIATLTLKGGVGKTTTTYLLGSMLAELRGDRVIALDANSDQGTLAGRMRTETAQTVQDLLNDPDIRKYYDVRAYTSQGPSRLEVLASNEDPAVTDAFSAADYQRTTELLERFYSICLSDCGTGLVHDVISGQGGVLDRTDQLIIVSTTSVNSAKKASETLDWLESNGYRELTKRAVTVINMVGAKAGSSVDLERLRSHFSSRCRAVVEIPVDPHLATDDEIRLDMLRSSTRDAVLELAAAVGSEFSKR